MKCLSIWYKDGKECRKLFDSKEEYEKFVKENIFPKELKKEVWK